MPRFLEFSFDPGPEAVGKQERRGKGSFLSDGTGAATVRSGKLSHDVHGLVRTIEVAGNSECISGTLVMPVDRDDVEEVDPRTLHVFRWDRRTERHELVETAGFNVDHGYVWARITSSGTYSIVGLPTLTALDRREIVGELSAWPLVIIIVRIFTRDGPWESLGPRHLSCCIYDFAIDPANSDRIYAAGSDSGIWCLDSVAAYPGRTWLPLTDYQPSLRIDCFAVSPANSQYIYYVDRAGQVFRSIDRGSTWSPRGSSSLGSATRLLAHPTDADTIYVASSSGFWCSQTGGATWVSIRGQVTLLDGDMTDAAMDPGNPLILYAAQRSVGLLKSSDGGSNWQTILPWTSATSPVGTMIKLAVGGGGTDANRTVAAKFDQEVFVNRNGGRPPMALGGGPWTSLGTYGGTGYGDWCHVIAVDPFDDNVILAGGQELYRTSDGGQHWTKVIGYYAPHEDQHRVVFDRETRGVVYAANDGGVYRSTDGGATFQTSGDDLTTRRDLNLGLVTAQLNKAAVSGDTAVGDAYHQGLLGADALSLGEWEGIEGHGWEFNDIYGDPVRPGQFFSFAGSALFRRRGATASSTALVQIGGFQPTSIAVDLRPGSNVILVGTGGGEVFRATDGNSDTPTWTPMPGLSIGPDVVVWIAFAPSRPQLAYALSGSGRVFICNDADSSSGWTEVTGLPLSPGVAVSASIEDDRSVFAITSQSVFRSTDSGGTWVAVRGNAPATLPAGLDLRSVVTGPGRIYVANLTGVFMSPDAGGHWFPYSDNLPNAELKELLWTESDLFAVTHGRGLWHHGRYEFITIPPLAHTRDPRWLIELYLAIYGGDPGPEKIRQRIGQGYDPQIVSEGARGRDSGPRPAGVATANTKGRLGK
jgi:photosystem II stability/assembly factor-like uncharacterized protein